MKGANSTLMYVIVITGQEVAIIHKEGGVSASVIFGSFLFVCLFFVFMINREEVAL